MTYVAIFRSLPLPHLPYFLVLSLFLSLPLSLSRFKQNQDLKSSKYSNPPLNPKSHSSPPFYKSTPGNTPRRTVVHLQSAPKFHRKREDVC
ncbi:hypothetical protein BJ165DRAFT_1493854 [Panaeolus papilionaceus]|nr:hypothetical protein BJ165DRAFT_1493800 [Panaeolus papilionaceus]KAF9039761.1 hypothetical protein BJ165DRAFT_1493854 [Panaeolus papilionaceus]